jgi:hypothetical protein
MSSHSLQEVPSGDWSDAVPVAESVRAASIRDDTDSVIDFGARKHVVQGEEGLTSYNGEFWDPESQPPELPIEAEMSEDISVEPSRSTPLTGLAVLGMLLGGEFGPLAVIQLTFFKRHIRRVFGLCEPNTRECSRQCDVGAT